MKNKKMLVSLLILIMAISTYFGYSKVLADEIVKSSKVITVTVIDGGSNYKKEYKHKTDAEKLGEALDEMGIIETSKGNFGRFVIGVDGIKADKAKGQWWQIKINGVDAQKGIDNTVIKDGDKIDFTYKTGL